MPSRLCLTRQPLSHLALAPLLAVTLAACGERQERELPPSAPPSVAGSSAAGLPSEVTGRILLGELGCVACHAPGDSEIEAAVGPRLTTVGQRVDPRFLGEFLASPLQRQPETVMPDLLAQHAPEQATELAQSIAHYLRSLTDAAPARIALDPEARTRGEQSFARLGCRECHGEASSFAYLRDKYSAASLTEILLRPHESRPSRRMPDFGHSPAEARDLCHYLLDGQTTNDRESAAPLSQDRIDRGRAAVAKLGCARCHEIDDSKLPPPSAPNAPALHELATKSDPRRGCVSGTRGPWPHYSLDEAQRTAIRAALATLATPITPERATLQALGSRRCFVCHRRDEVDGLAPAITAGHFATNDPNLGQEGSIPPTLTGVGAKLRTEWLTNTIAHGQRERDYLAVRMPAFGQPFAERLTPLLTEVDRLPPIEVRRLPEDHKAAEAVRDVGRTLVGDKGMNCITCHRFGGIQAGSMGAIDLAYTTADRLRPEWFAHFLRAPFKFKPATLMPHFFPDGKSTRPEVADGDVARQIDGLWHYLAEGRNVRGPSGLHPPPIELKVAERAVILRRSVQGTGKRGIAVGLPREVNFTFDAENLGMNQVWWGRFVDARPVWTSQGSGEAHILVREPIALPNGPAIVALDRPDQPWPTMSRRERGDRWLGYTLDTQSRPTLRYACDDVTIEDAPRESGDQTRAHLQRTLSVRGSRSVVWLRAVVGEDITPVDSHTVRVGSRVELHCASTPWLLVPVADTKSTEVRLPLRCSSEGITTTIEYRTLEQGK